VREDDRLLVGGPVRDDVVAAHDGHTAGRVTLDVANDAPSCAQPPRLARAGAQQLARHDTASAHPGVSSSRAAQVRSPAHHSAVAVGIGTEFLARPRSATALRRIATVTAVRSRLVEQADGSLVYTLPDRRVHRLHANGRLVSKADRNDNRTTVAYDGAGRPVSITDPAGRSIALSHALAIERLQRLAPLSG